MSAPSMPSHEAVRAAWEQYREHCFIRSGFEAVWLWSATHDFDFVRVGLHLLDAPGVAIDIGSAAMALSAFDALYIVPIVRLTANSLDHLQPKTDLQLMSRQAELRAIQHQAEVALERLVRARYDIRTPIASLHDQQQH